MVDWIQLPHWPVFNIADSCIVCGGVLAVLLAARGVPLDGGQPDGARPHGVQPDGEQPDGARPDGTRPDGDCPDEPRSVVLDARPAAGRPVTGDGGP